LRTKGGSPAIGKAGKDRPSNNGLFSRGEREKFLLHGGRWNRLQFPIQIEYGGVLAAAGKAAASRGQVDGKLTGVARMRSAFRRPRFSVRVLGEGGAAVGPVQRRGGVAPAAE
jgi:hypothetical protein